MSNQLIPKDQLAVNTSMQMTKLITSTTFLPRIQLLAGNSKLVKQGKFGVGHYGLFKSKDEVIDLGKEFDFLPLSWRWKAMDLKDLENIITVYNPESSEFIRIKAESEGTDTGCMWGAEFLFWLAEYEQFVTYFFYSKSARREAPGLAGMLGQVCNLSTRLIEQKKWAYHAPVVRASSNPMNPLPDEADRAMQIDRFNNPKEDERVSEEELATERDR